MTRLDIVAAAGSSTLTTEIALPGNFRLLDVLAFHQRDGQQVAERVGEGDLRKGLTWHGQPACLHIRSSLAGRWPSLPTRLQTSHCCVERKPTSNVWCTGCWA